jgi:hypothetical protein
MFKHGVSPRKPAVLLEKEMVAEEGLEPLTRGL